MSALEISFEELVVLLRTRFVGGEVFTANEAEVGSRLFIDVDQLKALRETAFVVAPNTPIARALELGGLRSAEVKAFVDSRADRLGTTIVLDPPTSCDPDAIRLCHLDASNVSADCRSSLLIIPVEIDSPNRSPASCWICRLLRR